MGYWCHYTASLRMPVGKDFPENIEVYIGKNLKRFPERTGNKWKDDRLSKVYSDELGEACKHPDEYIPFGVDGGAHLSIGLGLMICKNSIEDGKAEEVLKWFRRAIKIPGLEAAELFAGDDFDIIKAYYDGCCLSVEHDNPWK